MPSTTLPHLADLTHDLQSRSGWTREAALQQLASGRQPYRAELLPLVLQRLNDWVGPVRQAAEATLQRWWPHIQAAHLLASADALQALARGSRASPRWTQRLRARLLTDGEQALPLLQHMVLGTRTAAGTRPSCSAAGHGPLRLALPARRTRHGHG